jgi:hypothetical protein
MIEYSELRKLSKQIGRKIVYYSFNNLHPDQLLKQTLENFGQKENQSSVNETQDTIMNK